MNVYKLGQPVGSNWSIEELIMQQINKDKGLEWNEVKKCYIDLSFDYSDDDFYDDEADSGVFE